MKIYFVRHGESEANILKVFSNRGLKHPLTARGEEQAITLGNQIRNIPFAKIYSSPILRAVQTTEIVCSILNIKSFVVDFDIREYDVGIFEGRSDTASWTSLSKLEEGWIDPKNRNEKIEMGESFEEIQSRFAAFIKNVELEFHGEDVNILIVTHGGLLKVGLPGIAENVTYPFAYKNGIGNCELLVSETTDGKTRCLRWGKGDCA